MELDSTYAFATANDRKALFSNLSPPAGHLNPTQTRHKIEIKSTLNLNFYHNHRYTPNPFRVQGLFQGTEARSQPSCAPSRMARFGTTDFGVKRFRVQGRDSSNTAWKVLPSCLPGVQVAQETKPEEKPALFQEEISSTSELVLRRFKGK